MSVVILTRWAGRSANCDAPPADARYACPSRSQSVEDGKACDASGYLDTCTSHGGGGSAATRRRPEPAAYRHVKPIRRDTPANRRAQLVGRTHQIQAESDLALRAASAVVVVFQENIATVGEPDVTAVDRRDDSPCLAALIAVVTVSVRPATAVLPRRKSGIVRRFTDSCRFHRRLFGPQGRLAEPAGRALW